MRSQPEKGNAPGGRSPGALSVKPQVLTQGINMPNSTALTIGSTSVRRVGDLYSLNDLHEASGGEDKHRPNYFITNEQTKALIMEIANAGNPAFESRKGRHGGTYGCKELVIAYAAWINAAFHLKVIRVFLAQMAPVVVQRNAAIDYDRISPAQAQDLKQIVEAVVKSGIQGFGETWARLHRKFQVNSYLELPATRHLEARNYLIGKLPKGQLEDVLADKPQDETLNEIVARLARQLDEPNGYHVFTFLPLYEVIVRKLAKNGALPEVEMPEDQAREVFTRINRLLQLFHPLSSQFNDVVGIVRALRGLDPIASFRREGFLPFAHERMLMLH